MEGVAMNDFFSEPNHTYQESEESEESEEDETDSEEDQQLFFSLKFNF